MDETTILVLLAFARGLSKAGALGRDGMQTLMAEVRDAGVEIARKGDRQAGLQLMGLVSDLHRISGETNVVEMRSTQS